MVATVVNLIEILSSAVRTAGDLAGVFEFDGETGYFYLYDLRQPEAQRIAGAIHILSGPPDFTSDDVSIRWATGETTVGLFIRDRLWALFADGRSHGGDYRPGGTPRLPASAMLDFAEGD